MMVRGAHGTHGSTRGTPDAPEARGGHEPYEQHEPYEPYEPRERYKGHGGSEGYDGQGGHDGHPAYEPGRGHGAGDSREPSGGRPGEGVRPARTARARGADQGAGRATRREAGRDADPFDPAWVETWLRSLARQALQPGPAAPDGPAGPAARGEHTGRDGHGGSPAPGDRSANDQLLEALWPWALRTARAQAARLPPGADRDAVHGETLWEVYQAVRRIDWQRYDVWPALLKARLRAAWSAAARAEDTLTRGERQARTAYLAWVEAETQRLGRTLTATERYAIARRLRPAGGTVPVVLGRRLLSSAGPGDPGAVLQAATASAADDDPAVLLQRAWLRRAVRVWVAHDLPPDLRREVSALLERDEADHITHALLRRLEPYATALHHRIDD